MHFFHSSLHVLTGAGHALATWLGPWWLLESLALRYYVPVPWLTWLHVLRWHDAAELLFNSVPCDIHPHRMKACWISELFRAQPDLTLYNISHCFGCGMWRSWLWLAMNQWRLWRKMSWQCLWVRCSRRWWKPGCDRHDVCRHIIDWFRLTHFVVVVVVGWLCHLSTCCGGTRNAGGFPTSKSANEDEICRCLEGLLLSHEPFAARLACLSNQSPHILAIWLWAKTHSTCGCSKHSVAIRHHVPWREQLQDVGVWRSSSCMWQTQLMAWGHGLGWSSNLWQSTLFRSI